MKHHRFRKAAAIVLGMAVLLAIAAAAALHLATAALKGQVEQALGKESEVADIVVGWSAIELHGIRIRAPKGWPTTDALRAERVIIRPDLLGLFSARIHVPRITIENAYVAVWRTRNGKMQLLPGLIGNRKRDGGADHAAAVEVSIGGVDLQDGVLEFFDSTVRRPAHKTRIEQLSASVDDLKLPGLSGRTRVRIAGVVKGIRRDGRLHIDGWAELADRNSRITTALQGVDLVALQPYLIKASETGVKRGVLDMKLQSTVRNNRLHAPGTLTLSDLELGSGGSAFGTFMGIPRQAVVAALKDRNDRIAINFSLEGNLSDPRFSLNDSLAMRVGAAVAEGLGISIESLTRGVGSAAEGIGGVVRKLFGN